MKKGKKLFLVFLKQFAICILLMSMVFCFYIVVGQMIKRNADKKHIIDDKFSYMFQIDEIEDDGKKVVLDGWAFKLGEDATGDQFNIFLYDIDRGKIVYSKKKTVVREDVNDYFSCEYNYSNSGIIATFDSKKLDLSKKDYEVLIEDISAEVLYRTGTFISKGKQVFTNPKQFKNLEVKGTELEEITENGVLRVYLPDAGMYVYQYEGKLYWIAEDYYSFHENSETIINCRVDTTQYSRLPQYRIAMNWKDDNLDFVFEQAELNRNNSKYRVAVSVIPKSYSVTVLRLGNHTEEDGWIWLSRIRPWYEFNN